MSFGYTLYRLRAKRGLSQAEVARRASIEHSYVSRLESDNRKPSRGMVMDIASAFEASPTERDELLISAGFSPVDITSYLIRSAPELAELAGLLDQLDGSERLQVVRKLRELVKTVRAHLEAA